MPRRPKRRCSTVSTTSRKLCRRVTSPRSPPTCGTRTWGPERADHPEFQIEDGCITDQLLGDTYARLVGLGPVFDPGHVAAALTSIHRLNYVEDFGEWTNYMRTYAVQGERGHIVLSYPKGLPEHPMPYWSEVWTGLEYVYALGPYPAGRDPIGAGRRRRRSGALLGRPAKPLRRGRVRQSLRRAMASWGPIVALSGFDYDGRNGV